MEERLQKYMASCGVASRRKCEEIIQSGSVLVNGKVVTELGTKVTDGIDIVEVNGERISKEENKRYFVLNKPTSVITSVKDEKGRETVIDLVKCKERIYPVGRLDYDTSGLVLLTNDGDVYNKIMHPRVEVFKTYIAEVDGEIEKEDLLKLNQGVMIDDYKTAPAKTFLMFKSKARSQVRVEISEGKNRQVRRMFEAIGFNVLNLRRTAVGEIRLDNLKLGEYRELTSDEMDYLNSL